jgi:hypothetical protein
MFGSTYITRRVSRYVSFTLLITPLLACSESSEEAQSDTISMSMHYPLPAGKEQYICQLVQLPESPDGEIFMRGRSHDYNGGSHHYGLYRSTLTKVPDGVTLNTPEDCWGPHTLMQYATDFIILEQTAHVAVDYPPGIAMPFKSGEIMILELHAINPAATVSPVSVDVHLKSIPKGDVQQRMALLQFYDPFVYLPPKSKSAAALRCNIPDDMTLIEANPHFHLRGVRHETFIDPPDETPSTTPFLISTNWDHPPQWHGSRPLAAGSHVRFHCDYDNPDDREYLQGPSKNDNEMCSFWGYVYPAPEDRSVIGCTGENADQYGVGSLTCSDTMACIQKCPAGEAPDLSVPGMFTVGPCYMKCMVDSCPTAGRLVDGLGRCTAQACTSDCPGKGCAACISSNCASEASACEAHTCE